MRSPLFRAADHGAARLSRVVAAILPLLPLAAAADAPRYPPDTVLLLVAPWCAPCHGELARLDAIVAAAMPRRVRVFQVEEGRRADAMVRGLPAERRWDPPADRRRTARAELMARTPGLPFSVVTDAMGAVCAQAGGGLDAQRVRALIARCE